MRDTRIGELLHTAERHTLAGRWSRAVVFYRRVLGITQNGDFARELSHARLGDLHLALKQPHLALPHLKRAYTLSGEAEYALMLARALIAAGDRQAAFSYLHEALGSTYHATESMAELACCLAPDDRSSAAALARQAAARDPSRYGALARELADA